MPSTGPTPRTDVAIAVAVVDQPEIARAIERLRGDWAELSGGSLAVQQISHAELLAAGEPVEADVLIYPARYLGELVDRKAIRSLRQSVVEDPELAFTEILPVIREGELSYGGEYFAVPFGSRVLAVAGGGPPAEQGATAPQSAAERTPARPTRQLSEELEDDRFAAAWVLLAHAAPYARHPSQVGNLFDAATMRPQIDAPPYVRALEELVAAQRRPADGDDAGSANEESFWTWWPPLSSSSPPGQASESSGAARSAALPEAAEVYNSATGTWEPAAGGVARVPLIGANSFVGSVTAASRNAPAAFRLLAWLAGRSAAAGRVAVAPYRRSGPDALFESALSHGTYFPVPRIVEVDAYLVALDEVVRRAWSGDVPPREALEDAVRKWDEITDRVGRERQKTAYGRHLDLQ